MATIKSQMALNDGMSGVLRKITSALDVTLHSFEQVQRASGQTIDSASIAEGRAALVSVNAELDKIAESYRRAAEQEEKCNTGLDDMLRKAKSVASSIGAAIGLNELVNISDQTSLSTARISLLVDDEGSVSELENRILASAQNARVNYLDTASSVAKLGLTAKDAFSDPTGELNFDELIGFQELVNKNFKVGGASATEQASAAYQLTQAMASGRLQGDEYRSIIENAPLLAKSIEDYMRNVQGATGTMKEWASEGKLTSDVIKAAVFKSADEVEKRFESLPMTWGEVWTMMGNIALQVLNPVLSFINWLANNIEIIGPLVLGVAAALGVYLAVTKGVEIATKAWSAVQAAFNAVMALNPVFLIIMGVILLIAIIYAVVAAVNKATDSSTSATGIIVGALTFAAAAIWNLFLMLLDLVLGVVNYMLNPWISFANFLGNLFNDPVGAIIHLFGDMADNILGVIETIAKAIDKVVGSNLASAVQGWRAGLGDFVETAANQYGNGSYEKIVNELNLSSESLGLSRWDYSDAWDTGYNAGQKFENSMGEMFGFGADEFDYASMASNVSGIAENTEGMADALDVSTEELAYLRDIAEREAVNRFTTAEVKIDMTGMTNRIEGSADLDGVLSTLTDGFAEALVVAAEGVHA